MSRVIVHSEPTLGLGVPWALLGAPTGSGIQQDALETRFGSKGEPSRVCDLCPSVWVQVSRRWRGAQVEQSSPLLVLFLRRPIQGGGACFLLHPVLTGHPSPARLAHPAVALRLCWAARGLARLALLWEPAVGAAGTARPVLPWARLCCAPAPQAVTSRQLAIAGRGQASSAC